MPSIQKVTNAYSSYLPNRDHHNLDRYDDRSDNSSETSRDKKSKKSFKEVLTEVDDRFKRSIPSR